MLLKVIPFSMSQYRAITNIKTCPNKDGTYSSVYGDRRVNLKNKTTKKIADVSIIQELMSIVGLVSV